jgi:AcrR family transcriptional regulator
MSRAGSKFVPRKRQERGERRIGVVVAAAAELFAAHGFDGTSMSLIAQQSGMSIGSLYQYFPHKEAIVDAVAEEYLRLWREHKLVMLAALEEMPLEKAMRLGIGFNVAFHERHSGIRAFLDADRHRAASIAAVQAEVDFAVPLLARYYPGRPIEEIHRATTVVSAIVLGVVARLAAEHDARVREELTEEVATACNAYLRARLGEPLDPQVQPQS